MKILITGVAGFIGSHLAEYYLRAGNEVYGVDNFDDFYPLAVKLKNIEPLKANSNFHFFEIDITEYSQFSKLEDRSFDLIVHLAAKAGVRPSIEAPQKYLRTNVTGTLNILEYMRATKCNKLVFASSSSVYGNCKTIPFAESTLTDEPISPYAFSKKSCELLNYNYHHLYNLDILNLRFFTVYGPRQRPDLAIHKFMKKIMNGEPIEMYGDGLSARDYTFIDDTINGIVKAGTYVLNNNGVYDTINLGNSSPVQLSNLISAIEKVTNKKAEVVVKGMQEGDVDITYADISKAKEVIGYDPQTKLEAGLKKFYDWYVMNNAVTA
ncbi:MAG: GDP-mannose 4,6-dehydratase [Bacteroidetes bacterium]|nr:GDP-mannose 4,6-dehydratase [Bacteroidota bacterium]